MASGSELSLVPIRWISVEGNIGSGKSTFVSYLRARKWPINYEFVPEPVHIWESIRDPDTDKSMLELFYENKRRNAFSFQMMAYISRLAAIRESIRKVLVRYPSPTPDKPIIIITERCLETDANVFAKMLYDDGKIRDVDYQIYKLWFDEFIRDLPKPILLYVRTKPEICSIRINRRLRKGEEGIPIEYLVECHRYHDIWIANSPRLVTSEVFYLEGDVERDITEPDCYDDWMEMLENLFS